MDRAVLSWLEARPWDTASMNIDYYRDEVRASLTRLERQGKIEKRPSNQYRARWEYRLTDGSPTGTL